MKILVVGSGGREHALAWALARSEGVDEICVCPGNGGTQWSGTQGVAPCRRVEGRPEELAEGYDLVVVGPEAPLVEGLADKLSVPVFGPSSKAAQIEASKDYAKQIMGAKNVPTARHAMIDSVDQLNTFGTPVVVKDDGLAAGKGVGVFDDLDQAKEFYLDLSSRCDRIFVEEYLSGPELSVLAFCDGKNFSIMPPARDYKRRFEEDKGPNTGGMGAISPVSDLREGLLEEVGHNVIAPVLEGLADDGAPFVGVLYAGLKLTPDGPKVLEFNCRFGDPETQVILPQFEGNLAKLMLSCAKGRLDESYVKWSGKAHTTVVLASDGYPGSYTKGFPINGLDSDGGLIFQAGTAPENGHVVTNGGRVLALVGRGSDLEDSTRAAYKLVESVSFEGAVFRKDIGS
jgi:phosphoribosylamine--glycine ligase